MGAVQTGATIVFYFLTRVSMMVARVGTNYTFFMLREYLKANLSKDAMYGIVGTGCVILTPIDSELWAVYAVLLIHDSGRHHYSYYWFLEMSSRQFSQVILFLMLLKAYLDTRGVSMNVFQRSFRVVLKDGKMPLLLRIDIEAKAHSAFRYRLFYWHIL